MKSRAIFLSGYSRVAEIKQKYGCKISANLLQNYLFELSGLSPLQHQILRQKKSFFSLYDTNLPDTKLLSVENDFDTEKNQDSELSLFYSKLKLFYSTPPKPLWKFSKAAIDFNEGPVVMGILNVTPDSFYDGSRYNNIDNALEQAFKMSDAGAKIIDIGGESTRPGAQQVSLKEELTRVIPIIKELSRQSQTLISIDTYKSEVARAALDAGADIVNDISGSGFDPQMVPLIKEKQCPYIVMHIKGTPRNMQNSPQYDDAVKEIYRYFEAKIQYLKKEGIENIAIDPGIGFGKRLEDNLRLIRDLRDFSFLNSPILIGASRKSMIAQILNAEKNERLIGSIAVHLRAALNGADIIRTHDVQETIESLKMSQAIDNP